MNHWQPDYSEIFKQFKTPGQAIQEGLNKALEQQKKTILSAFKVPKIEFPNLSVRLDQMVASIQKQVMENSDDRIREFSEAITRQHTEYKQSLAHLRNIAVHNGFDKHAADELVEAPTQREDVETALALVESQEKSDLTVDLPETAMELRRFHVTCVSMFTFFWLLLRNKDNVVLVGAYLDIIYKFLRVYLFALIISNYNFANYENDAANLNVLAIENYTEVTNIVDDIDITVVINTGNDAIVAGGDIHMTDEASRQAIERSERNISEMQQRLEVAEHDLEAVTAQMGNPPKPLSEMEVDQKVAARVVSNLKKSIKAEQKKISGLKGMG